MPVACFHCHTVHEGVYRSTHSETQMYRVRDVSMGPLSQFDDKLFFCTPLCWQRARGTDCNPHEWSAFEGWYAEHAPEQMSRDRQSLHFLNQRRRFRNGGNGSGSPEQDYD